MTYLNVKIFNHLIVPSILFLIFCLLLATISSIIDYSWEDWRPASCITTPQGCFCEKIGDGTIRQPLNAWSSLTFALLGFLIFFQSKRDINTSSKKNFLTSRYVYAFILGSSLIVIGLGSVFYHASLSFAGQTADVLGMYFFVNFIIIYGISRIYPIKEYYAALAYIFLNLILAYFLIIYPEFRRYIFAVALLFALFIEFKYRRKKEIDIKTRYIISAFLIFLFSFIFWLLDTFKILCNPEGLFQGHAIWHLGGSVAAGFLYLYYRSENSYSP